MINIKYDQIINETFISYYRMNQQMFNVKTKHWKKCMNMKKKIEDSKSMDIITVFNANLSKKTNIMCVVK